MSIYALMLAGGSGARLWYGESELRNTQPVA
jgi:hypothetical protein